MKTALLISTFVMFALILSIPAVFALTTGVSDSFNAENQADDAFQSTPSNSPESSIGGMTIDSVPLRTDPVTGEVDLHVTGEAHALVRTPKSAYQVGEADSSGSVRGSQGTPASAQVSLSPMPITVVILCVGLGGLGGLAFLRRPRAKG